MDFIKYIELNKEEWNASIQRIEGSTFKMTAENIDFMYEYGEHFVANESFLIIQDKNIIGMAILLIENLDNKNCISWAGRYCPAPFVSLDVSYKMQEKYIKDIFKKIEQVVIEYKVEKICYEVDPLVNPLNHCKMYNYNYLMKFGFLDDTSLTQMIMLDKEENVMYSDIRKGHKSDIKKGFVYDIEIFDKDNITDDKIELYRAIYEADAGKVTRNSELYLHYYKFIKNGKAAIAFAKKNEEYIAVIICTYYKKTGYYSSYAELTDKTERIPPGHILQWEMMKYLKSKGVIYYEIGEQEYGKTHYHNPDNKEKNISLFKRGFGGYIVSHLKGIRENEI